MTRVFQTIALGLLTLSMGQAAVVTYNGNDTNRGQDIVLRSNPSLQNPGVGLAQDFGFAGVMNVTVDGNPLAYAFCLDWFIDASSMTANASAPSNANETRVAWLLENAFPLITSTAQYAGLQLAIWDIVHDSGDGFGAGVIQSDPLTDAVVLSAANGFLTSSAGQSSLNAVIYTNVGGAGASQSMITGVPEPATLGLAGLVLLGLGASRKIKKT